MIEATIALIVAVSTALGLLCDKCRQSRCQHIACRSCCGLFEVDRAVPQEFDNSKQCTEK